MIEEALKTKVLNEIDVDGQARTTELLKGEGLKS